MQIKLVPIGSLIPDPDVQYEWAFDKRIAKLIGSNYDPMLAGVIDVIPLNGANQGKYGVFVGRHRLAGAITSGEKVMRCAIWSEHLSLADKHRIKLGKDRDRRHVRAVEMFLNEVAAGEVQSCDVLSIVEDAGFTIGKNSGGKPYTQIEAVQALRKIYQRGGRDVLRKVLALNTLWLDEPHTNTGTWLGGLDWAISEGWTDGIPPTGYERMKALIPGKVIREARGLSTGRGSNWNSSGLAVHIAARLRKASGVRIKR